MRQGLWTLVVPFALLSASCGTGGVGQAAPSTLGLSSDTTVVETAEEVAPETTTEAEEAAPETTTESVPASTLRTTPTTGDNSWAFDTAPFLESVVLTSDDMIGAGFLADWEFRSGQIGIEGSTDASVEDETLCGFDRLNTSQGLHVRLLAEGQELSQVVIPDAGDWYTQVIEGLPNCEFVTVGLDPVIVDLQNSIAGSNGLVALEVEDESGFKGSVVMAAFGDSLVLLSYGNEVGHRTEDLAELVALVGSRLP